ncbi:MAG: phospholipase D-like domain-containing protein, partial [Bacteroidota bacterium]
MPVKKHTISHGYTSINRVSLIRGGKEYFDTLVRLINTAKESIHIQSYIFDDDTTGSMIADALKKACERKVEVYVLADGYASQVMSKSFIKDLKKAGIHFRFFEPFFKSTHFYFGRRMHHKISVFDARYALVGGVNIADRYNDLQGKPAWLDFAIYAEGEIA